MIYVFNLNLSILLNESNYIYYIYIYIYKFVILLNESNYIIYIYYQIVYICNSICNILYYIINVQSYKCFCFVFVFTPTCRLQRLLPTSIQLLLPSFNSFSLLLILLMYIGYTFILRRDIIRRNCVERK